MKHKKIWISVAEYISFALLVWAVLTACATCLEPPKAEAKTEPEEKQIQTEAIEAAPEPEPEAIEPVANTNEPEEVTEAPVMRTYFDVQLSHELQDFIAETCEAYHIPAAVVVGIIQKESDFNADAMGDNGNSYGLMQIQKRWQADRMARLGCDDLLDPFQNVSVGIDILAELVDYYDGNVEMALMAYNAGQTGAYNEWFQYGIYSNSYSQTVLTYADELTEGVITYVFD